jgi:hypothetical protein
MSNSYNIYRGYGNLSNTGHVFQNGDATILMQIQNNGNLILEGNKTW